MWFAADFERFAAATHALRDPLIWKLEPPWRVKLEPLVISESRRTTCDSRSTASERSNDSDTDLDQILCHGLRVEFIFVDVNYRMVSGVTFSKSFQIHGHGFRVCA